MKRFLSLALAVLAGTSCSNFADQTVGNLDPVTLPNHVNTFDVTVTSVTQPDGTPLTGGDGLSEATAWPFPFTKIKFHIQAQAIDLDGSPDTTVSHVVAIRVAPGDIDPTTRTLQMTNGVAEGDILASHVYGRVTVEVRDGPADEAYDSNGQPIAPVPPSDPDATYTFNSGVSQILYFNTPMLSDIQRQEGCDPGGSFSPTTPVASCNTDDDCTDCSNSSGFCDHYTCYQHACLYPCEDTTSPLSGDFVRVDEPFTSLDAGMIVTAITSDGFYVTDLSAQKMAVIPVDAGGNPTAPEWDSLHSTFGHIFVYNYSAPTDLFVGDHIISLTGSVEEFSGDTQLDFPGWIKVNFDPQRASDPNFHPEVYVPQPQLLTVQDCGSDATHSKTAQDLCGYFPDGLASMGLESLESAPVMIDHVKPSNIFVNCDQNGDGKLPLFANSSKQGWYCFPDDPNFAECACYIACATGRPQVGPDGGTVDYSHYDDNTPGICSELSTYNTYNQWEVVMPDLLYPDGGVEIPSDGTRINVQTGGALPTFNPKDLAEPQFQGITFRIAGMLNQVEASRPRWLIQARDPTDVCCYPVPYADGGSSGCPYGVETCEPLTGK